MCSRLRPLGPRRVCPDQPPRIYDARFDRKRSRTRTRERRAATGAVHTGTARGAQILILSWPSARSCACFRPCRGHRRALASRVCLWCGRAGCVAHASVRHTARYLAVHVAEDFDRCFEPQKHVFAQEDFPAAHNTSAQRSVREASASVTPRGGACAEPARHHAKGSRGAPPPASGAGWAVGGCWSGALYPRGALLPNAPTPLNPPAISPGSGRGPGVASTADPCPHPACSGYPARGVLGRVLVRRNRRRAARAHGASAWPICPGAALPHRHLSARTAFLWGQGGVSYPLGSPTPLAFSQTLAHTVCRPEGRVHVQVHAPASLACGPNPPRARRSSLGGGRRQQSSWVGGGSSNKPGIDAQCFDLLLQQTGRLPRPASCHFQQAGDDLVHVKVGHGECGARPELPHPGLGGRGRLEGKRASTAQKEILEVVSSTEPGTTAARFSSTCRT